MLRHVKAMELTTDQLMALVEGTRAGPPTEWLEPSDILGLLLAGGRHAFSLDDKLGMMMVHVEEANGHRRLSVDAIRASTGQLKTWARDLRKLAADWSCDTIETICYSNRLARAIMLLGAEQEAVVLRMEVRGEH